MASTTVQLSGGTFQDLAGNPLALGTLVLTLSQDGQVNADAQIAAGSEITIQLDGSGNVVESPAQYVWPNDVITPANTFYNVSAYTANGQLVWGPNAQQILSSPSPFNIGAWVPAEVNTGSVDVTSLSLTTTGSSGASTLLGGVLNIPQYSGGSSITLTTTGTSGAATLTAGVLNIPVYAGGVTSVFTRTGAVVAVSGDYSVGQVTGAAPLASPTFTGTVTGPTIVATTALSAATPTAATSGANQNSPAISAVGNYWNGSASAADTWSVQNVMGPGTNPVSTLTFSHSGSSGGGSVSILSLVAASINSNGIEISNAGLLTLTSGHAANSSTNYNSATVDFNGNIWNGTAGVADDWTVQSVMGTGSNPTSTLTFAHTGSSGAAAVAFDTALSGTTINATSGFQVAGTALASTNLSDTASLARLSGPAFTGVPTAPTAAGGTNTTQIATTAFVTTAVSTLAPIASPTFTGTVGITFAPTSTTTPQLLILAPNLLSGNFAYMGLGVSQATNNEIAWVFRYAGLGSTSNSCTFNFYGNTTNNLVMTAGNLNGINQNTPAYPLDVVGAINTSVGYKISGTALASTNLGDTTNIGYLNGTNVFTGSVTVPELKTTQTPTASSTASDHSVPIVLNGTTYYMRLSTTA